ncbi:phage regulatory protein/antirepressor Ant [Capnocytophaga haemolytica]
MKELVFENKGQAVTNSLLVAEKFGKEHFNVLQTIDNLITENSILTENQQDNPLSRMFVRSEYAVPLNNGTNAVRMQPMYIMNRDGFSLLVMGFTGARALQFKIDFIEAFNAYEQAARNPAARLSKIELAQMVIESEKEKQLLEQRNQLQEAELKKQAPKVEYFDKVLQSESTYPTTLIAKELGMSAIKLNQRLHQLGVQFNQSGTWVLYSQHQDKGYTKTITRTFVSNEGKEHTSMLTVWTEKGRLFIHNLLKSS